MRNTSVDGNVSCQHFPIEPPPLMVWLLNMKNVAGMTAESNVRFYLHWANLNSHLGPVAGICDSSPCKVYAVWSVAQLCLTLCNPIDWSLPGSSVHGVFPARVLERVAISYFSKYSWPRDGTHVSWVSCTSWQIIYHWATCKVELHIFFFPVTKVVELFS